MDQQHLFLIFQEVFYKLHLIQKDQILYHPKHDYTKGLIACLPPLKNKIDRLPIISNFSSDKQTVDLFKQKKLICYCLIKANFN